MFKLCQFFNLALRNILEREIYIPCIHFFHCILFRFGNLSQFMNIINNDNSRSPAMLCGTANPCRRSAVYHYTFVTFSNGKFIISAAGTMQTSITYTCRRFTTYFHSRTSCSDSPYYIVRTFRASVIVSRTV